MPLLIDCYNVLHSPMPPMLAGLDEGGLCLALARTPWHDAGITVVCDGRAGPLGLSESPVAGVKLAYSGPNRSADDVIIARIDGDTAPRRLTVVSSDRQIRRAAGRRRAASWTSENFVHRLVDALHLARATQRHEPDKPDAGRLDADEVEHWLRRFGVEATEERFPTDGEPRPPC